MKNYPLSALNFDKYRCTFPARPVTAAAAALLASASPAVTAVALTFPLTASAATAAVAAPVYEKAAVSALTSASLPNGALRLKEKDVPDSVHDLLKSLVKSGGDEVRQGKSEVVAWTGRDFAMSKYDAMRARMSKNLKSSGWTYEENGPETKDQPFILVSVMTTEPTRRGIIGVWAHADDTLMLAWTELLPAAADSPSEGKVVETDKDERSIKSIFSSLQPKHVETPPVPEHLKTASAASVSASPSVGSAPAAGTALTVAPSAISVNVMKNAMPTLPKFSALTPKRGFVRGYVKDSRGNPLKGAVIGVRSSAAGGFYSGASGKSDAKGYYEVAVPWGAAEFYTASITQDYGDGRAAFGLHPTDGEADGFATANGLVENWVLLPYGIADRDKASDDPKYSGNYYGGTFTVSYHVMDSRFPDDTSLPDGSEIELNLISTGPLIDGSKGKTFVLNRRVQEGSPTTFFVNNVPVGQYRVVAWLKNDGKPSLLKLKETGPMSSRPFGLEPKEGKEGVVLTFRPGSAKAGMSAAAHGNWDALAINLSR